MSFFESPPPLPADAFPTRPPQPPWVGPGDDIGVAVAIGAVMVRTDEIAVLARDLVAYSNGFEIQLVIQSRSAELVGPRGGSPLQHARPGEALSDELFRFGLEFSDGRRATSTSGHSEAFAFLQDFRQGRPSTPPAGPLVLQRGGGGSGRLFRVSYWVWPLPPPGPIRLACEWPARGIALTFIEIDGDAIRAAGEASEPVWPAG